MMCRNELEQNLAHMPYGKGPKDFEYVYTLGSFELLKHRNPIDGSAVIVLRWVLFIVPFSLEEKYSQKKMTKLHASDGTVRENVLSANLSAEVLRRKTPLSTQKSGAISDSEAIQGQQTSAR